MEFYLNWISCAKLQVSRCNGDVLFLPPSPPPTRWRTRRWNSCRITVATAAVYCIRSRGPSFVATKNRSTNGEDWEQSNLKILLFNRVKWVFISVALLYVTLTEHLKHHSCNETASPKRLVLLQRGKSGEDRERVESERGTDIRWDGMAG